MTNRVNKLAADVVIYGISDVLPRITVFITLPIYTRLLNVDDYAIWNLLITLTSIVTTVLALGADSAYVRYFFEAKTTSDKQLLTSTWLYFLLGWSGIIVLVGLPFYSKLSELIFQSDRYVPFLLVSFGAIPISIANTILAQALRNQFRAKLFAVLNIISVIVSIVCSLIGAVVLNLGLMGIVAGASVAVILLFVIRLWFERDLLRWEFSPSLLGKLVRFGAPLVPSSLAYWIFLSSDRLLLVQFSTTEQLGWYAVANTLASTLMAINSALAAAWTPHALELYQQSEETAAIFYGKTLIYIVVGFGLVATGVTAFSPQLLSVLTTPEFAPASMAVGPLALGAVAFATTQITALSITLKNATYYIATVSWLVAIFNVIFNVIFMPSFGMMAASWSTALSYSLLSLSYVFISQRLWNVHYNPTRTIKAITVTVAFVTLAPLLPNPDIGAALVIKAIYCGLYIVLIFVLRVFDQRELVVIAQMWDQFKYRLTMRVK